MADDSMLKAQTEISTLKDTLCAQQLLLQKLYDELDAERESSATAAGEALSMILRLQGEKSAIKMEADQYKKLSEQKICHTEESLELIEDLIYQKEMEVAALDYQVQAYRYKLISMGCEDLGGSEIKYPEDLLQRNEALVLDAGIRNLGRRNSAPVPLKYKMSVVERQSSYKSLIERASSTIPEMDVSGKIVEEIMVREINEPVSDLDMKVENSTLWRTDSYRKQMSELDELVKEISGDNYTKLKNESLARSLSSQLSFGNTYNPSREDLLNETDQTYHGVEVLKKTEEAVDYPRSSDVHDVFEAPKVDQSWRPHGLPIGDKKKKPSQGIEKKLVQSSHRDKNLSKPSEFAAIGCCLTAIRRSASVSESQLRLNRLIRTSEAIEVEKTAEDGNREEEIKLLKEIKDQINLLHVEIRHWKVKKASTRDEPPLYPLSEAMLYFWL